MGALRQIKWNVQPAAYPDPVTEVVYTPISLHRAGICLCDQCGRMASTDFKWCEYCKKKIIVFLETRKK